MLFNKFKLIKDVWLGQDVGQAVLESYSRILESLAYTVLSRIEDVLHADYQTQHPTKNTKKTALKTLPHIVKPENSPSKQEVAADQRSEGETMTLSDFMGWAGGGGDSDMNTNDLSKDTDGKIEKLPNIDTNKKVSYLENLGNVHSPTSRD